MIISRVKISALPELVIGTFGCDSLVGDGREYVAAFVDPMTKTVIERRGIDGRDKILARSIAHAETLIQRLKRRAWVGTRDELGGRIVANSLTRIFKLIPNDFKYFVCKSLKILIVREFERIYLLKLIGSVDGGATFLGLIGPIEERYE